MGQACGCGRVRSRQLSISNDALKISTSFKCDTDTSTKCSFPSNADTPSTRCSFPSNADTPSTKCSFPSNAETPWCNAADSPCSKGSPSCEEVRRPSSSDMKEVVLDLIHEDHCSAAAVVRAGAEDVFPRGPSVSAEEVIAIIDRAWESSIFQTQDYIYDVLCDRRDPEFVNAIRNSIPYTNVLRMLRTYDSAARIFEPMEHFRDAGPLHIDYKKLGVENWMSCEERLPVLWKKVGSHLSLRFYCEFPREHVVSGKPFAIGYAALLDELDLWHQWNPVITNSGPDVLHERINGPDNLHGAFPPSSERIIEQSLVLLKLLRFAELNRMYKFIPPNKATYIEVLDVVSENGKDNNHEILRSCPPARGMRKSDPLSVSNVMIMQKDTCFVGVGVDLIIARVAPAFFVSWILKSLVPVVVGNLFKSGARTLDANSVYFPRLQEDRDGLYQAISSMRERGGELEEERGYRFNHQRVPEPEFLLDIFGSKNLLQLDLHKLTDEFGPQVPHYSKFTREKHEKAA